MAEGSTTPALAIRALTMRLPDGRTLLSDTDLTVEPGEFVVLVGPSGSGKTTLLRRIAGLDEDRPRGVTCSGVIEVSSSEGQRDVGLVFQNHALFDELTARGNVRIAADHRAHRHNGSAPDADKLLSELHVNATSKPATLSGGEKQRVAVARTLAMDPAVLLFDEPTTGLDPARSQAVVELIAQTNRHHKKTTVVVTHDYEPFLAFGPRLVLLDAANQCLREVEAGDVGAALVEAGRVTASVVELPRTHWRTRLAPWLEGPGRAMVTIAEAVPAIVGSWHHPVWKLRYLLHYTRMVAAGTTALYVAIAGAMLGYVFVNFSFAQLPYAEVTVPLLTEEFLAATGYSTYRVIVPLLIAVLVAGKVGASISADIGTRRYTNQLDAMRNCKIRPIHYLYGNIAFALIVGVPLLTVVAFATNCYASLVAFLLAVPEGTVAQFWRNYFATVWPAGFAVPAGSGWVLLKMSLSGLLVAGLSYAIGSKPKTSPVDVSRDVGLTIFWSSLSVLLLHSIFSRIEF